jgi:hypothetical protein
VDEHLARVLRNTGDFMNKYFKEVCETILRYRDHKEKIIKRTVITLLPRLAAFASEEVRAAGYRLFLKEAQQPNCFANHFALFEIFETIRERSSW